ncbi:hypothetical protein AAMO2058_001400700 [Amorphochlora amoebiformis]|mmetsp:Transcript_16726/g.26554  ORF Transcript_16726/g.26554 Transcript_16726/m.26554 type:complete len:83 (-) Transcript_16726:348-596(-)
MQASCRCALFQWLFPVESKPLHICSKKPPAAEEFYISRAYSALAPSSGTKRKEIPCPQGSVKISWAMNGSQALDFRESYEKF